jgi:ankyrin repeat protein
MLEFIKCFYREGHEDIVRFLHSQNSEVWNTKSKNGRSPLHTTGEFL